MKHFKTNLWSCEMAQWAMLATQGRQPEFSPRNPQKDGEPTPRSCPVITTCTWEHTQAPTHANTNNNHKYILKPMYSCILKHKLLLIFKQFRKKNTVDFSWSTLVKVTFASGTQRCFLLVLSTDKTGRTGAKEDGTISSRHCPPLICATTNIIFWVQNISSYQE